MLDDFDEIVFGKTNAENLPEKAAQLSPDQYPAATAAAKRVG